MKKKLGIMVCFDHLTDRVQLLADVMEQNILGFAPESYTINNELDFEVESFLKDVRNSGTHQGIMAESESVSFHITFPAKVEAPLTLTWEFDSFGADTSFLKHYFAIEGFVCAYEYDYWDVFWQSEVSKSAYEMHGRDHTRLKMTKDKWDRPVIDVSSNPGRQTLVKDLWIMAGPRMYLGPIYCNLVCSKERLLQFKGAVELENNVIFIELLNGTKIGDTDALKKLRVEQQRFLDFIDLVNTITKLS